METIFTFISFALLGGILLSPLFIFYVLNKLKIKNKFWLFSILGIIITASLSIVFTWWACELSTDMLLSYYG